MTVGWGFRALFGGWLGANVLAVGQAMFRLGQVMAAGDDLVWWPFKLLGG